jgi:hypothetical protein
MILNETFASNTYHFEQARRAQSETPFTHQNQVVELQKSVLTSQNKAQVVPETKNSTNSTHLKQKGEKEEFLSYTKKGLETSNLSSGKGSLLDSSV